MKQVGLIVATDPNGVIGVDNAIPWNDPADKRRFKRLTMHGALIVGRRTFESMGRRQLPGRFTYVVSSTPQPDVMSYSSVEAALKAARNLGVPIWVIGGSQIYREVLEKGLVDFADVTFVPAVEVPEGAAVATFPLHLLAGMKLESTEKNPDSPIEHRHYTYQHGRNPT